MGCVLSPPRFSRGYLFWLGFWYPVCTRLFNIPSLSLSYLSCLACSAWLLVCSCSIVAVWTPTLSCMNAPTLACALRRCPLRARRCARSQPRARNQRRLLPSEDLMPPRGSPPRLPCPLRAAALQAPRAPRRLPRLRLETSAHHQTRYVRGLNA